MKIVALGMIVGGWMVTMGGLVGSEAIVVRLAAAVAGLGTSLAGIATLNSTHITQAIWNRGH